MFNFVFFFNDIYPKIGKEEDEEEEIRNQDLIKNWFVINHL